MEDEAHMTVPLSLPIFASSSSFQIIRGSSPLSEKPLLPLGVSWRRYFLQTWQSSVTGKSSFRPLIINLRSLHYTGVTGFSVSANCWSSLNFRNASLSCHWCIAAQWDLRETLVPILKIWKTIIQEIMDFFHLLAVDNQKVGLNKLEVEVATGITQYSFLLKTLGRESPWGITFLCQWWCLVSSCHKCKTFITWHPAFPNIPCCCFASTCVSIKCFTILHNFFYS